MSAFICTPLHIATCAAIVKAAEIRDLEETSREDIAEEFARENMRSVAFRYGDEGREFYKKLMAPIIEHFEAMDGVQVVAGGPADGESLADMMDQSPTEFIAECRAAPVAAHAKAEAFMYLACLEYQSCEHPEWRKSKARRWIELAQLGLGYDLAKNALQGHVWTVPEDAPVELSSLMGMH